MCPKNLSVLWVSLQKKILISLCVDTSLKVIVRILIVRPIRSHWISFWKNTDRTNNVDIELVLQTISQNYKKAAVFDAMAIKKKVIQ